MRISPVFACVVLVGAIRVAVADEPSVEERLRQLEARVATLEAENAKLRAEATPKADTPSKPEATPKTEASTKAEPASKPAAPPPAVVKAAGKEAEIKLGGLLQVEGEVGGRPDARFTDKHDRIYLRRARVNVGGRFLEEFEWRTEIELAGSLANASALRAQLTDAYASWKRWEALDVRGGQFKTPFGYEQLYSDPKLPFAERSLGSDRLTLSRLPGLQLSGSLVEKRFTWAVGAFNGTPANTSGNDDDRFLLASRLSGVPAQWRIGKQDARWSLGVNGYRSTDAAITLAPEFRFDSDPTRAGNDNVLAGEREAVGGDTQLVLGKLELWGEWLEARFKPDDRLPTGRLVALARSAQATMLTAHDRILLGVRWDDFDPNRGAGADRTSTWTTGLTWLIRGHDLKLQTTWMAVNGPPPAGHDSKLFVRMQLAF